MHIIFILSVLFVGALIFFGGRFIKQKSHYGNESVNFVEVWQAEEDKGRHKYAKLYDKELLDYLSRQAKRTQRVLNLKRQLNDAEKDWLKTHAEKINNLQTNALKRNEQV